MTPKTASDIKGMEKAGRLAAETLNYIEKKIEAGMTTLQIDQLVHEFILSHDAIPATLGYHGFPNSCCTSPNDVICHGVPDKTILKNGDLINVDVTCIVNGYFGDHSKTFEVGKVSAAAKKIREAAHEAMMKGIEAITPGATVGDIGFAIEKCTTRRGFFVVHELGGHGIGRKFHEEPFVPSFGKRGKGAALKPWTCITVEPMINETSAPIKELEIKGSTIMYYKTGDQSLSAQFEHTVLITDSGYQILTQA